MSTSAMNEFKAFIEEYMLRLLGIPYNNETGTVKPCKSEKKGDLIFQKGEYIYFSTFKETLYRVQCQRTLTQDDLSVAKNILTAFFRVSEYAMDTGKSRIDYFSDVQRKKNYEMAVQKGICTWIVGNSNNAVERLMDILEKWSVQTYEGKKVTYGFLINPYASSPFQTGVKATFGSFLDFVEDDFSAVFTDCIHSAIELDGNCEFCRYLSVEKGNRMEKYTLNKRLPLRFAPLIQKYVTGRTVGLFLLNNGDIILSKEQEIRFVKRNLRWLNISYDAFRNSFDDFATSTGMKESLIESIYASTLDVSFAHSGGIISVVDDITPLISQKPKELPILSAFDYLGSTLDKHLIANAIRAQTTPSASSEPYLKGIDWQEIKKRALKRNALESMVGRRYFTTIDRKLRAELISLDGACILTPDGKPCAFGAIITNDSGSSGGGRGAAAKKLSRWGIAIKISTDGYIELYRKRKPRYTIK